MSSLFDFEILLAPIPGDDPAGSSLPFEVRQQLEQARLEIDDPSLPPEDQKKANWPQVVRVAQETLQNVSKDLLVAARLTEGMVKLHGFAGLRDSLRLLRRLVEECWDRIYPRVEDGDLEVRAAPFNWLDVPDRSARFPTTLRMVPLVGGASGRYSWLDWQQAQEGKGSVTREDFEKAVLATSPEDAARSAADINQSLEELDRLTAALADKMGPEAPGLTGVRRALEDCRVLAEQVAARRRPASAAETYIPGEQPAAAAAVVAPAASRPAATRAEAYRQLAQAAAVLQEIEPHSPVPHLVQWAVQLGEMPFPQLMKELIRNESVLNELSRILGIKELSAGGGTSGES